MEDARPARNWYPQALIASRVNYARLERRLVERLDPKLTTLTRACRERVILDRLAEYGGCDD